MLSPVQHYWSLAVEEQFYLVVPLCLLAAAALARKSGLPRKTACLYLIVALSAVSFVHSIAFSAADHDVAYFATSTRVWELGLGGILALTAPRLQLGERTGRLLGWAGLAAVLWCAFTLSTFMDFPGYVALVPVVATVLVLAAGTPTGKDGRRRALQRIVGARYRAVQIPRGHLVFPLPVALAGGGFLRFPPGQGARNPSWIGDSAYQSGRGDCVLLRLRTKVPPAAPASAGEPRGRPQRPVPPPRRVCHGVGTGGCDFPCGGGALGIVEAKSQQLDGALNIRQYPGAMALDRDRPAAVPSGLALRPDPAVAMKDVPLTGGNECGAFDPSTMGDEACRYGRPDAERTILVVGDSHAAQLVDPLLLVGEQADWNVQAMVRNGCPFSAAPPESSDTVFHNCPNQNLVSLERILHRKPDLVVVSGMTPSGYRRALQWGWKDPESLVSGYVAMLKPLRDAGIRVAVVMDIPYPDFAAPDCVQSHGPVADACTVKQRAEDRPEDLLAAAASRVPGVEVIDFYPYFCADGACPSVVGNVLVYRDNHMTNSFARTLASPLGQLLRL
ncbi:acyltransferase family protein [Pseudarthrobacter sp. MDT3-1]